MDESSTYDETTKLIQQHVFADPRPLASAPQYSTRCKRQTIILSVTIALLAVVVISLVVSYMVDKDVKAMPDCPMLDTVGKHVTLSNKNVYVNTVVIATCDAGYVMSDGGTKQYLTCIGGHPSSWSEPLENCTAMPDCPMLDTVGKHVTLSNKNVFVNTVVIATCDAEYVLPDGGTKQYLTCIGGHPSSWSEPLKKCTAMPDCPALDTVGKHVTLSNMNVSVNTVVTVTCQEGYVMSDGGTQQVLRCIGQLVSTWNEPLRGCTGAAVIPHTSQLCLVALFVSVGVTLFT